MTDATTFFREEFSSREAADRIEDLGSATSRNLSAGAPRGKRNVINRTFQDTSVQAPDR